MISITNPSTGRIVSFNLSIMTTDIQKLFIDPKPKIGYGQYAIRKSLIRAVSDLKEKISGEVVDLGCGIMPYRAFLEAGGKIRNYRGIDLQYSDYHNEVRPDLYWDGKTIPLADNSQDWLIATEFLEHYFDTQQVLKEIKRVLKPGGRLFFTFPFIYMLHEVPYDYNRFTPYAIEQHFKDAAFTNVDVYPLGGFNHSLVIMMSLWNKNSGKRGLARLFSKLFLFLFHKDLLNNDTLLPAGEGTSNLYKNGTMPSGLWGYALK